MDSDTVRIVEEGIIAYYKGLALSLGGQFYDQDDDLVWFCTGRRSLYRFNGVLRAATAPGKLAQVTAPIWDGFRKRNLPFLWIDILPAQRLGWGSSLQPVGFRWLPEAYRR